MLMTAQPLHAYDLDKVPGGELIVRTARPGEKMTTLDDVERELDAETVLVCDRDQPTGIAALMGGQVSEVSDTTTDRPARGRELERHQRARDLAAGSASAPRPRRGSRSSFTPTSACAPRRSPRG